MKNFLLLLALVFTASLGSAQAPVEDTAEL